ncbi:MAG: hypothetical protein LBQ34_06095 [Alphaproteobacteria bacterium]|jgi:hypothetical protein|nr:hypothetical protein [Alphaproteobacteria bacterium]
MKKIQTMIRKKAKTIFCLMFILCLAVEAQAFDFTNNTFMKISNLPNNKNPRLSGYLDNSLSFDSLGFEANLILDDSSYIYSLQNRSSLTYARGSGGVLYTGDTSLVKVGFFDGVASKSFYNNLFGINNPYFGVQALSRLDSEIPKYYTLGGAYIENNTALSASYLQSFFDESLYFGLSLTPSMSYSIAPHRSISYQEDKAALDGTLIYYNELNGLGYGINGSSRYYMSVNDTQDNAFDTAMGINLDYFGFALSARSLWGDNNFELLSEESREYKAFETSLYYSIMNVVVGGYYLHSAISTKSYTYQTEILELDAQYSFGESFTLYSALFYETLKLNNNTGLLLGFSVSL